MILFFAETLKENIIKLLKAGKLFYFYNFIRCRFITLKIMDVFSQILRRWNKESNIV